MCTVLLSIKSCWPLPACMVITVSYRNIAGYMMGMDGHRVGR